MTRKKWLVIIGAVVLLGGGGAGAWFLFGGAAAEALGPTATVTRGPLPVTVTERGELEAEKRKSISSEIEYGNVVVKDVIADGTIVEPNQVVLELECRELDEALTRQIMSVQTLETSLETLKKNLELKKQEVAEKVRKAEDALTGAEEDLRRYKEGEWPIKQDDANSAVVMAERDLSLAREKLEFKLRVNEEMEKDSPYSKNDIEAERLSVDRLKLSVAGARNKFDMLIQFDHPKEVRKLDGGLRDANLALQRADLEKEVQVGQATREIARTTEERDMQKRYRDRLQKQSDSKILRADGPGLVIYESMRYYWPPKPLAKGETVNPRQPLLLIPNLDTIRVKTRVLEAVYEQVKKGQRAVVRLDARPDVVLTGQVDQVAPMPSQAGWDRPDVKSFEVFIKPDELPPGLKPNMTARVEIILAELQDVLRVPVAAVFAEGDQTWCWRVGSGPQKVPVRVGQMNDTMVEIISGLSEGDTVLLVPPKDAARGSAVRLRSTSQPTTRKTTQPSSGPSGATRPVAPTSGPTSGPTSAPSSAPASMPASAIARPLAASQGA
jgi:HlyD family secretion protein